MSSPQGEIGYLCRNKQNSSPCRKVLLYLEFQGPLARTAHTDVAVSCIGVNICGQLQWPLN